MTSPLKLNMLPGPYNEKLVAAKKQGYKWLYRWVNSDSNWDWVCKSISAAEKGAIDLYMSERGDKMNIARKDARKYMSEFIDILPISDIID